MAKHDTWRMFNATRHGKVPVTSPVDTEDALEGGGGGYGLNPNLVCPRCSKPLSGRVIETLTGERVHTHCYVRGGQR